MTAGPTSSALLELVEVIGRLRRECAWKAGQTHLSLTRYLLEETHETVEAIESGDPARLRDELGDVLLQVYLHAAIAAEAGDFDVEDVAAGLVAKMVRRNPHVFGDESETDPERINERWQQIKAQEKADADVPVDDGIPQSLPALLRADKVVDRLERAGRPVTASGDGVGERLLALVVEAHRSGIDPEQALRRAVDEVLSDAR